MTIFAQMRLERDILQGLEDFGLMNPTNVQRKTIPKAMEGKDVSVLFSR